MSHWRDSVPYTQLRHVTVDGAPANQIATMQTAVYQTAWRFEGPLQSKFYQKKTLGAALKQARKASGLNPLKGRIEALQLHTGVGVREVPIGFGVVGVAVDAPCADLAL